MVYGDGGGGSGDDDDDGGTGGGNVGVTPCHTEIPSRKCMFELENFLGNYIIWKRCLDPYNCLPERGNTVP